MLLPALFALSLACILAFPIAVVAVIASFIMRAADGLEIAVVVSRRSKVGARGQRVIASARLNRSTVARGVASALDLTGRTLTVIRSTARAAARRAARTADGQADRAGALALCLAVWLAPWAALELTAGAGLTVAVYVTALALGGAWIRAARPSVGDLARQTDGPSPIGR
jgi:hypothetical protein